MKQQCGTHGVEHISTLGNHFSKDCKGETRKRVKDCKPQSQRDGSVGKALAAQPDALSSLTRTHQWEKKELNPPSCPLTSTYVHTLTQNK